MRADRELDALVAERVMGLRTEPYHGGDYPCPVCGQPMWTPKGFPAYARARCGECNEWRYGAYKEYSEDIDAAWEVVIHLMGAGPHGNWWWSIEGSGDGWVAMIMEGAISIAQADADTAPLAICLAALKAVE